MKNKFLLFLTTFLLVLPQVWSQSFIEDFELQTVLTSNYANGSFEGAEGITFSYVHSRNEGLGTGDDYSIEGKGIMLRRADEPSSLEFTLSNGVGNLSFDYRKAFTGGNNNRQLAVFVNGVQEFVTPLFGGSNADPTVHNFSGDINVSGPTTIKITYPTGTSNGNKQITIDNISWTASETPSDYSITVTQTEGGNISPSGTVEVEEGGTIEFTATADACYAFSHWIVDGENAGNTNPYVFTNVTADHTISAVFEAVAPYTITATAGANGTITPDGATSVDCGADQIFTITANVGYQIADVLVDGASVGAISSYTFTEVSAEHTISATFELVSEPGDFCVSEDFENMPTNNSSGYIIRTWTGNGGIEWTVNDSRGDQTITGKAVGLRNSTLTTTSPVAGGVGTLSFDYKRAFSGNSTLKVFVNGIQYGGNITVTSETPANFSVDVNVEGDVIIELVNSGNRSAVDNLKWTCFEIAPCETPLPTVEAQEFCEGATVADLVAEGAEIKWYDAEDAATPLTEDTVLVSGTYYVTQTIDGCESEKLAVEITVNPTPEAPIAEGQEFCEGATVADLVAEGTEINWYDAEDATTPLTEDTVLATGTYYVTQTIDGCESERFAVEVVVNATPEAPVAESPQEVAEGATIVDLVVEGENLIWYNEEGEVLPETTVLVSGTTYYVTQTIEGCESEATPIQVVINSEPGDNCFEEGFDNLTEIPTGTQYGPGTYTNNGITWNFHGQSPIGANGEDYTIDGQGILLRRASDSFLEATIPAGVGVFTFEYRKAYTGGSERQLELLVDGVQVATTPAFGAGSGDNPTVYAFSHTLNTTESVVIRIKLTGETSSNRHATIDNISWTCGDTEPCETPLPTAEAQEFCEGATVADLVAEGAEIKWYDAEDATTPLTEDTVLVAGTYYVTQTIDGCESEKLAVEVEILPAPEAPIADSPQEFTPGQTLADLVVEGENLTWYDANGDVLTEDTPLVNETTYYVTQTIDECESAATEILVVDGSDPAEPCFEEGFDNLTEIPTGTQYGSGTYTNNGITWNFHGQSPIEAGGEGYTIDGQGILLRRASDSFLEATIPAGVGVFSFEYRKAYTGGNERQLELLVDGVQVATTPAFGAGSGADDTVYTFTHTLNTEESVVVRIKLTGTADNNRHATIDNISWTCEGDFPCDTPLPVAEAQAFCGEVTVADLTAEGNDLKWYATETSTEPLSADQALTTGTYYVTQTILNCESERLAVDVTVSEIPEAPIAIGNFDFVQGDTLADLEDSLEYEGDLTWYEDEALTIVLPNTTLLVDGAVYFVTQTINGCESEALTVETNELGIDNYGFDSFSYYPNPVKDYLSLRNNSEIDNVEIYNLAGAKLMSQTVNAVKADLNLKGLDTGIYILKINSGKEVKTVKIIKK